MTEAAIREIEERLQKVVIHLTWREGANQKVMHGTAFFVTPDGMALTAFHNIAETLAVDPHGWLTGEWQGQALRFRWKLPEDTQAVWQRQYDIAVIESETPPSGLTTLDSGYLDAAISDAGRSRHLARSPIVVSGFPRGHQYALASGDGHIHPNPLGMVEVEGKRYQAFRFGSYLVTNGIDDGPGLSGSPVYSPSDAAIIGIVIAARTDLSAAELWPINRHWDGSSFLKRLPLRRRRGPPPRVIRRLAFAASLAALLTLAGWMAWRQSRHTIPLQITASVTRLDTGRLEPVTDGLAFRVGERVRFQFRSPKDGHLYVVDQEIANGKAQDPFIIFPTLRTSDGMNKVKAGDVVEFPDEKDKPPYVEAEPSARTNYDGELFTLLIFPDQLPVRLQEAPVLLEPQLFSLNGRRPRAFVHPLAPPADAVAIRQIRLRVTK